MSFKIIELISKTPNNIKRYSKKLVESFESSHEIKNHQKINSTIINDKTLSFKLLSKLKPNLIDIKGIHNEKKINLAKNINSFHKIYYKYCRNLSSSIKQTKNLSTRENLFTKNFKKIKEKNNSNKKQYLGDLKEEYEKSNYHVPAFIGNNKNIFNRNLLLSNVNELKNFILFKYGSKKSNIKALSFLEKIKNEVMNKRNKCERKSIFILKKNSLIHHINNFDKIIRNKNDEINNSKNEIKNIKSTIELINEIDFFLIQIINNILIN